MQKIINYTPYYQIVIHVLLFFLACLHSAWAEVRLLTGDAENQPHRYPTWLLDISADGDYLLFASGPPPSGTTPGIAVKGYYVRRLSTNTLEYALGAGDPTDGLDGSLSNNGRYLAWSSAVRDVYWRDRETGLTKRLTSGASNQGRRPIISGDGRFVVFCSTVRDLVADSTRLPANGRWALYRWDSQTGSIEIVSLNAEGGSLTNGVGPAASGFLEWDYSLDGRYVVYATDSANAHPDAGGNANAQSVYRRDLSTGEVLLLNRNSSGAVASGSFSGPRISGDGRRVVFLGASVGIFAPTRMTNSAPVTFYADVYVKDIVDGTVWWASRTVDGTSPDAAFSISSLAISGNGDTVAFGSTGAKFVQQNTDLGGGNKATDDIFRVDLAANGSIATTLISEAPGVTRNISYLYGPLLPGTGDYVAFGTYQYLPMLEMGTDDNSFVQAIGVGDFSALSAGSFSTIFPAAGTTGALPGFGYYYDGYYPFVWNWNEASWLYVYPDGASLVNGFYFWHFAKSYWGWTAQQFLPLYTAFLPEGSQNKFFVVEF